jgi:hypothetical protein
MLRVFVLFGFRNINFTLEAFNLLALRNIADAKFNNKVHKYAVRVHYAAHMGIHQTDASLLSMTLSHLPGVAPLVVPGLFVAVKVADCAPVVAWFDPATR